MHGKQHVTQLAGLAAQLLSPESSRDAHMMRFQLLPVMWKAGLAKHSPLVVHAGLPRHQHSSTQICVGVCGSCEQGELQPSQHPECICRSVPAMQTCHPIAAQCTFAAAASCWPEAVDAVLEQAWTCVLSVCCCHRLAVCVRPVHVQSLPLPLLKVAAHIAPAAAAPC